MTRHVTGGRTGVPLVAIKPTSKEHNSKSMNDTTSTHHHHQHQPHNHDNDESSSEDPLLEGSVSFDENETAIDDLDVWNPEDPRYTPPVEDMEKGDLQRYMEDETYLAPGDHRSYVFMLVQSAFPDWNIPRKTPYFENEMKELKDKKPREYQALKIVKRLLVKEIRRRDDSLGRNSKNKTISALFGELERLPLRDPRDVFYLKNRERELRATIRTFLQRRSDFEKSRDAAAADGRQVDMAGSHRAASTAHRNPITSMTTTPGNRPSQGAHSCTVLFSQRPSAVIRASTAAGPDRNIILMNSTLDKLLVEVSKLSQAVTRIADTMVAVRQEAKSVEDEELRKELASLKRERRELQIVWAKEPDPASKHTLLSLIEGMNEEIAEITVKRQRLA
ncbi:hypothetical protein FisN_32Hh074 [Fistulifera solaris]|uniref:Uncharacterized protein n=1 Tax=Fistulifera solaris TaxID=1519565 RepID=A0A1Z5K371_FISSO|nr:hypothetical protein FisN_32Hh074 [Fistulifera solaris]|eukprot:GAX20685.1 hypothetical protein FisN_32Hh074 [Fistulifera solaris]